MLPCRESARLISASRERRLTLRERFQLFLHLRACEVCRRYKEQLEFIDRSLRKAAGLIRSEARLRPEARKKIIERLED